MRVVRSGGFTGRGESLELSADGTVRYQGREGERKTFRVGRARVSRVRAMLGSGEWRSLRPLYAGTPGPEGGGISITGGGRTVANTGEGVRYPDFLARVFRQTNALFFIAHCAPAGVSERVIEPTPGPYTGCR